MKKLSVLAIFTIMLALNGLCQEIIDEAKISFDLPNNSWELIAKKDYNDKVVYFFKREPLIDSLGREIIPNISFVVEPVNKKMDVVTYSAIKRGQVQFEVKKVFIHEDGNLNLENAIGYEGIYNDKYGEHTVYVIHAINNKMGVQIIFDILSELFNEIDTEFIYSMKSLKVVK